MQRKACVEFVNSHTVRITTPLYQKEFDLAVLKREDKAIDLVTMKSFKVGSGNRTPFRAEVWEGDGSIGDPYRITVLARTSEREWDDEIGTVDVKSGTQVFLVTFPDRK